MAVPNARPTPTLWNLLYLGGILFPLGSGLAAALRAGWAGDPRDFLMGYLMGNAAGGGAFMLMRATVQRYGPGRLSGCLALVCLLAFMAYADFATSRLIHNHRARLHTLR